MGKKFDGKMWPKIVRKKSLPRPGYFSVKSFFFNFFSILWSEIFPSILWNLSHMLNISIAVFTVKACRWDSPIILARVRLTNGIFLAPRSRDSLCFCFSSSSHNDGLSPSLIFFLRWSHFDSGPYDCSRFNDHHNDDDDDDETGGIHYGWWGHPHGWANIMITQGRLTQRVQWDFKPPFRSQGFLASHMYVCKMLVHLLTIHIMWWFIIYTEWGKGSTPWLSFFVTTRAKSEMMLHKLKWHTHTHWSDHDDAGVLGRTRNERFRKIGDLSSWKNA